MKINHARKRVAISMSTILRHEIKRQLGLEVRVLSIHFSEQFVHVNTDLFYPPPGIDMFDLRKILARLVFINRTPKGHAFTIWEPGTEPNKKEDEQPVDGEVTV